MNEEKNDVKKVQDDLNDYVYRLWQVSHSNFGSELTCVVKRCRLIVSLFRKCLPQ